MYGFKLPKILEQLAFTDVLEARNFFRVGPIGNHSPSHQYINEATLFSSNTNTFWRS